MAKSTFNRLRTGAASVRGRAVLSLGVVLCLGATGTLAAWTDNATIGGVTLTAGKIDLKVNDQDNITGYAALNASAMMPGNSTAAVMTVKNAGTVPLQWTLTSSGTDVTQGPLGMTAALDAKVTSGTVAGSGSAATCTGTPIGSGQFSGTIVSTPRTLAAGASEKICVQATLNQDAPSSVQGGTANIVLTFKGTTN